MPYTEVNDTIAVGLVNDWINLARDWGVANGNQPERDRLEKLMDQLAEDMRDRCLRDLAVIERGFAEHQKSVAKWEQDAAANLAEAKKVSVKIKKNPTHKELPDQLKHFTKQIALSAASIKTDAKDYGESWKTYRGNPWASAASVAGTYKFPEKYTGEFMTRRGAIINDQKAIGTALDRVRAMQREAESLALITDKAVLKQSIAAGNSGQRPIAAAQKIAADGATQSAELLANLKQPKGLTPKPESVTTNANNLKGLVDRKEWPKTPKDMITYDGVWKNAEAGYKRLVVIEANLKTLSANLQKGLRSTELKDPQIKQSLAQIAANIKEASTLVKAKAKDYAVAKAAYPKIVAGHQALLKTKAGAKK